MNKLFLNFIFLLTACGSPVLELKPQTSEVLVSADQSLVEQSRINPATNIAVISDLNGYAGDPNYDANVTNTVQEIIKNKYDLVLMPGDLISVETSETDAQIRAMWAGFEKAVIKPFVTAHISFAFAFGNHDTPNALSDSIAKEFWLARKDMLGVNFVDAADFPFRYSFQKNNHFFFSWETNTSKVSNDNFSWLNKTLQVPQAKNSIFKLGLGHVPLYAITEARNSSGETLSNYQQLQTVLESNKVDIYTTGHHHAFYPAIKNGVHYLHNGCLGGGQRPILNSSVPAFKSYSSISLPGTAKEQILIKGIKEQGGTIVSLDTLPKAIPGFDGRTAELDIKP